MGSPTVATLWVGAPLGPYERLCLTSFCRAGHEVVLFSYEVPGNLPRKVALEDARSVIPEEEFAAMSTSGVPLAFFADVFRYRLLRERPVTWIDADVFLLGDPLPDSAYLFGYEDSRSKYITNGILRAPAGSILLANLVKRVEGMDLGRVDWGASGPLLLTSELMDLGLLSEALPAADLFPIPSDELALLFDPRMVTAANERLRGAFTVHLWNEVMRRGGAPVKQVRPPAGSWLDEQFRMLGVDFESSFEHDVKWITEAVTPAYQKAELEAAVAHFRRISDELERALAAKHHEWVAAVHDGDDTSARLRETEHKLDDCSQRLAAAHARLDTVESSRSWRFIQRARRTLRR